MYAFKQYNQYLTYFRNSILVYIKESRSMYEEDL